MANPLFVIPDANLNRDWTRPLAAVGLSALVHLALLAGIPVNPTGGAPDVVSTIYARLEAASGDTAGAADPNPAPVTAPDKSTTIDPLADPVAKKSEPKPETKPAPVAAPSSPSSGVELPLVRDPTYYTAKQLDVIPKPIAEIRLNFPEIASANGILEGNLLLLVLIDEFGVVNDVSVIDAQPAGYFEDAARGAFRSVRWVPARIGARAVKSRIQLRVRYVPDDKGGNR